jgi:MOSC domain-containing protein YiiM
MSKQIGHIHQININPEGGVPKYPVEQTTLETGGVAGDKQRHRKIHGGPMRAVCLFSLERIEALQAEGHPIVPGTAGENLTIAGLDWESLSVGDRLLIGELVEIELTSYTAPCENIAESFAGGTFTRISQKLHPGWSRFYAKVLSEGEVHMGDRVVKSQNR